MSVLVLAAASALAGCGSSSTPSPTLAEFAQRASDVCTGLSSERQALYARAHALEQSNPSDSEGFAALTREFAAVSRDADAKVQALARPPAQAGTISQLVTGYFQEATDVSSLASAVARRDARSLTLLVGASKALAESDAAVARSLGMTACARVQLPAIRYESAPGGKASATAGAEAKSRAVAYAHSVNLRQADLLGMASVAPEGESHERSDSAEAKCGLRESHVHVVDIQSPKFKGGSALHVAEVRSDVEVLSTAAQADAKLTVIENAFRSSTARNCLQLTFAQAFAKGVNKAANHRARITPGATRISMLATSVPHSFGVRLLIPLTVSANGVALQMRFYIDAFGFVVGRSAIGLTAFGLSNPVPGEQDLLSLLYGRASTHAA